MDLQPGAPNRMKFNNCCKSGVLAAQGQGEPSASVSAFQISVGQSSTSKSSVKPPNDFYFLGPAKGYTCGRAALVSPSVFTSGDGHRRTKAMMTWSITCTHSPFLASKNPTCCVSMSTFYNCQITPCPSCSCGCQGSNNCVANDNKISSVVTSDDSTMMECTQHMCPVQYWRVKLTVTNFNYRVNYTQWTLVVQHPNLNNLTEASKFLYNPINQYRLTNDTGMFYGIKDQNDVLLDAWLNGNVQTEMLLKKDKNLFTFDQGRAFPSKIYFNGDECVMPLPDSYPTLPNSGFRKPISWFIFALFFIPLLVA